MATKEYDFKYLPLEGKLTGKSFEAQTEAAINELGQTVVDVEIQFDGIKETAQQAYDAAKDAQDTADTAKTTADNAQTAAENAQSTADAALASANSSGASAGDALLAAQKAQQSANEAKTAADNAQISADDAQSAANVAQNTAESAQRTADTALSTANNNTEEIRRLKGDYETVGKVYLNDYYSESDRIYVDADSKNAPTDTEKFFVEINLDTENQIARQFATGAESGTIYIRNGVLTSTEPEPEPLTPTNGTLKVNGDLSTDLTVNGNVEVTGTISGILEATGTITYGELTGNVTENAELHECDIQVDGGNLTFSDSVSNRDGALYTEAAIDNTSNTTTIIYMSLTADTEEEIALTNEGTLTVEGMINITSSADDPITNSGTIDGDGEIYVNDEMYYDGGIQTPTTGTLVIDGDLSADLIVNGSVEITGKISSSVTATGTITYGSLADSAEVEENAEIHESDFSVDEGSLTLSASLTDDDGLLKTSGAITNTATTIIDIDLTAEVESGAAFVNSGALTVDGNINANSTSDEPVVNEGTIDGTGTLYANGEIFYDGSTGYSVEWGEWTEIALQSSLDVVKETADNALESAGKAQTSADSAQETADQAVEAASTAQTTADNAETLANEAQKTADQAVEAASAAQTTADNAETLANAAQETADEALKTAQKATLTGTVGSETNPIYLEDGTLKASEATVGSGSTPVYLNEGEIKPCDTSLTDYLPLSGGTVTGNLDMAEGTQFTVNGLTLTSEGHILLASGVEIY